MAQFGGIGGKILKLSKNAVVPGGRCFGLVCGTAGTANFIDADGNACANFPLQAGYNPISISTLSSGGTADDIWALFERP